MAKVVKLRSRASTEQEAAAWIARLDRGLSSDEEGELRRWLAARRSHRDALFEMAALWDEADRLAELSALFPLQQRDGNRSAGRFVRWAYAVGAVVALAAAAWLVNERYARPPGAAVFRDIASVYRTGVGERTREVLPDGSVVTLNTRTEIVASYTAEARDVVLRSGEASFEVAEDADRPFTVYAGRSAVQALGTVFNVRLGAEGQVEVTVTDGNVGVAYTEAPVGAEARRASGPVRARGGEWDAIVTAGQVAVLDAAETAEAAPQVLRLEPVDMDIKLAWQRGMLIFRGEPLEEVLEEVARYTTTEFVLADEELASIRVGGYFRAGDIEGLLAALRENFQIEAEAIEGDKVLLRGAR